MGKRQLTGDSKRASGKETELHGGFWDGGDWEGCKKGI